MRWLVVLFVVLLWFTFIGFWQAAILAMAVGMIMFKHHATDSG